MGVLGVLDEVQHGQSPQVDVGGVAVTHQQLNEAIAALGTSTGNQVKAVLVKCGSPLAVVDHAAVAATEVALDPTLRKGKAKTKNAFLRHLHRKAAEFLVAGSPPAKSDDHSVIKDKGLVWTLGSTFASGGAVKILPSFTWHVEVDKVAFKLSEAQPAPDPAPQPAPEPVPEPTAEQPPSDALFKQYLATEEDPAWWTTAARRAFAAFHQLDTSKLCDHCWGLDCGHNRLIPMLRDKIRELRDEERRKKFDEHINPTFTVVDPQPALTGWHKKIVLADQHGQRWLFKPAADGRAFRAEIEHGAHQLARAWGFPTAESRLIIFDGVYGQIQRMFVENGNFAGLAGKGFDTFSTGQLIAVACEHILDWALDNDDSKGDNLIVTEHGRVVGVDKARAWRYFGAWDGLSSHDSANSNAPLVYTELYRAIKNGALDKSRVAVIYRAVIAKAHRMQALPDSTMEKIIRAAVANRPHYSPPSYCAPFPGAPGNADELVTAAVARKNNLVADMTALWARVYADAGWSLPQIPEPELGLNIQGHPMFAGLHSPGLHEAVTRTKSYGTATFVAGRHIEDAHVLLWRERVKKTGVFRVRGQFKVRDDSDDYRAMVAWCTKNAKDTTAGVDDEMSIPFSSWYWMIVKDSRDRGGSSSTYYVERAIRRAEGQRAEALALLVSHGDDPGGKLAATVAMCEHYLAALRDIAERRKALPAHEPITDVVYTEFTWTTAPPQTPEVGQVTAELVHATRAAAGQSATVKLASDGELDLDGTVLSQATGDYGQYGRMYLIILPTGEEIEFRSGDVTSTTMSGTVQFTIPDQDTMAESLHRIQNQLAVMGLTLPPADRTDLELFYWRHLANILADRHDTKRENQNSVYAAFWAANPAAGLSRADELSAWRAAFATLPGGDRVEAFRGAGGHLPRFLHLDMRRPEQPTGKPHWVRFDVSADDIAAKDCLGTAFGHGPRFVMATGAAMSTEARLRTFAIWKSGASSSSDLKRGSGDYTFSRQNHAGDEGFGFNVFYRPDVLARTHTYAFGEDRYGQASYKKTWASFAWDKLTGFTGSSNEVMVKYAMSVLDDIEVLVFDTETKREKAIKTLAGYGVTELRGVPVEHRFITSGNRLHLQVALHRARLARQP